jgi:hypothetical protein
MTPCARCETALEPGDLRCAICALPVPDELAHTDEPPRAQLLRCGECSAAIGFSPEARAPRCGFCGATMAIEQPVDPIEEARLRVPLTVDRAAAEAALRGWLADRGWLAPPALASVAVLDSLTPVLWAAWLVNAEARVTWAADSDAGARRSAWAPHAGEAELAFRDIIVPASRGLGEAEARRLLPYYQLERAIPVDRAAEPGEVAAAIERFDAQRSAARSYVHERITAAARVRIEPRIPGRRYRNVRVACLLERQTTERVALPAWILAYRYRGKPYRAIVHGQRAEIVLGRSPIDWAKLGKLAALVAVLAAIIVAVVLVAQRR